MGNLDGSDDNRSWNCGAEGDTDQVMVVELRHRMMKNAFAVLLCSRGTPMFLAGDEFGNTQFGNNNAYCQDNEISWLDWTRKEKFQDVFDFCAYRRHFGNGIRRSQEMQGRAVLDFRRSAFTVKCRGNWIFPDRRSGRRQSCLPDMITKWQKKTVCIF